MSSWQAYRDLGVLRGLLMPERLRFLDSTIKVGPGIMLLPNRPTRPGGPLSTQLQQAHFFLDSHRPCCPLPGGASG